MHRLFTADFLGGAQNSQRAADIIMQVFLALLDQKITSLAFVLNDPWNDFVAYQR